MMVLGGVIILALLVFVTNGYYSGKMSASDYAISASSITLAFVTLVLAFFSGKLASIEERRDRRELARADLNRVYNPLEERISALLQVKGDLLKDSWLRENQFKGFSTLFRPSRFDGLRNDLQNLDNLKGVALKAYDSLASAVKEDVEDEMTSLIKKGEEQGGFPSPLQRYHSDISEFLFIPLLLGDEGELGERIKKREADAREEQYLRRIIRPVTTQMFLAVNPHIGDLRAKYSKARMDYFDLATKIHSRLVRCQELEGEKYESE